MDEESATFEEGRELIRVVRADERRICLDNGIELEMPCKGEISSYLEFLDRIMAVLYVFDKKRCDWRRNIFCWRKEDGELLWQVERARRPSGVECEGVYKLLRLEVKQPDGEYRHDGDIEIDESLPEEIVGKRYLKPFRRGEHRLVAETLEDLGCVVEVDYETGRVRPLGELDRWGMRLPPDWGER